MSTGLNRQPLVSFVSHPTIAATRGIRMTRRLLRRARRLAFRLARRVLRQVAYRACQVLAALEGVVDAALEFGEAAMAHLSDAPQVNPALAWDEETIDAAFTAAMPEWERAR